ncbi:hypothetical protein AB0N73_10535 [Microbacterium sp. NPDC089189]|uniref:hypothetical protein n=1 Tax=Microbacterium sp. NPDC089189 TaxID=3154972 RepID=UPI00341AFE92
MGQGARPLTKTTYPLVAQLFVTFAQEGGTLDEKSTELVRVMCIGSLASAAVLLGMIWGLIAGFDDIPLPILILFGVGFVVGMVVTIIQLVMSLRARPRRTGERDGNG